jgi:hypothetical protein
MAQQTAVEWMVNGLLECGYISKDSKIMNQFIKKTKAIEKEQIKEAFRIGEMNNDSHHYTGRKIHKDQTDYFNKTYKK